MSPGGPKKCHELFEWTLNKFLINAPQCSNRVHKQDVATLLCSLALGKKSRKLDSLENNVLFLREKVYYLRREHFLHSLFILGNNKFVFFCVSKISLGKSLNLNHYMITYATKTTRANHTKQVLPLL